MNSNIRNITRFLSSKVRFMHTSTTTTSHSCSEKTTRTPHVHLIFYIVDTVNKYLFWVDKTEFIVHRMLYSGNENLRVAEAHSAISSLSLDQKVTYIPYISINA